MNSDYKYELELNVTTKRELTVTLRDEDTGDKHEKVIPQGSKGIVHSCGRSSVYGFEAMYDVTFYLGDDEPEVTFFEKDLEEEFDIESTASPSPAAAE